METSETGIFTILFGFMFFIMGFLLFGDKAMILAGNILIIAGVIIYNRGSFSLFISRSKIKGTTLFILGLAFMVKKAVFFGFIIEMIGILLIISERIPSFKSILRRIFLKLFKIIK